MRNATLIAAGIFLCVTFSWLVLVIENHKTISQLMPITEDGVGQGAAVVTATLYPPKPSGMAEQGKRVYVSMGCVSCHTQQVSKKGYGGDFLRGWGDRGSVPRDYVRQKHVLLGNMRIGSDLANAATEEHDAQWHLLHLYNPRIQVENSSMPGYAFLFKEQEIDSRRGPSPEALSLPEAYRPPEDYEIVPTNRADALAAYLLSLKQDYDFPETKPAGSATDESAANDVAEPTFHDIGQQVYKTKCAMCHQANGAGLPKVFPSLIDTKWITGSKQCAINIVLSGINGPINVKSLDYNGNMPAWGALLNDKEIAAVLTYVRSQWNNKASEITPEEVAKERQTKGIRPKEWTAEELLRLYPDAGSI